MSDDNDPLADADIGETATVEATTELWAGDLAADAVRGSDRFASHDIATVEVRTNERGNQVLDVTVRSDVTKQLPRRWDRTARDTPTASTPSRWRHVGGLLLGAAVALGVSVALTQRMLGALAGETVTFPDAAPTLLDLAPGIGVIVLLTLVIGMLPYLPGKMGGMRR
jgi:hypothetical protein